MAFPCGSCHQSDSVKRHSLFNWLVRSHKFSQDVTREQRALLLRGRRKWSLSPSMILESTQTLPIQENLIWNRLDNNWGDTR